MHKQRPTVDEIILRRLQVLGEDIVLAYLDVGREGSSAQQAWIEIRRHHLAQGANALRQPAGNGAAPSADINTPPSGLDPERVKIARGHAIVQCFDQTDTLPFDVLDRKSTRLNSSHLGISY